MLAASILALVVAFPPARPEPPPALSVSLPKCSTLIWGQTEYACQISAGTLSWHCTSGATTWVGWLEIEGDAVTLVESIYDVETGAVGPESRYEITLDRATLRGVLAGGMPVEFRRHHP